MPSSDEHGRETPVLRRLAAYYQGSRAITLAVNIVCLAACIASAFIVHGAFLNQGFFEDDYWLERRYGTCSWATAVGCLNPVAIHWFYRPVFVLWLQFFGSLAPGNPVALHAGSLVLFGTTIALIAGLVYRLTGRLWLAGAAAAMFLLAPNIGEAVSWIASASTLLAAVFALAALHFWMSARERGRRSAFFLAYLAMVLGMASKEDVAAVPAILIVFDLYLNRRLGQRFSMSKSLIAWGPLVVWTIAYTSLDLTAYRVYSAHTPGGRLLHPQDRHKADLTCGFALRTLIFSVYGDPAPSVEGHVAEFAVLFVVLFWRTRRNMLIWSTVAMAMVAVLPVPLSSGQHAFSDRFNYVPEMFAALLAVVILSEAWGSCPDGVCASERSSPGVDAHSARNALKRPQRVLALALWTALLLGRWTPFPVYLIADTVVLSIAVVAAVAVWASNRDMRGIFALLAAVAVLNLLKDAFMFDDGVSLALFGACGALYGFATRRSLSATMDGVAVAVLLQIGLPYSIILFLVLFGTDFWRGRLRRRNMAPGL